ncbi:MAG TPA: hypothetical protein GX702_08640, partial [Chloroflexi bacterium]|nr:hypothetical protein [Chloroflexota bacterium]
MATLRRLATYLAPYPWWIVFLIVGMLVGLAGELALPFVLRLVVDKGIAAGSMPVVLRYTGMLALIA